MGFYNTGVLEHETFRGAHSLRQYAAAGFPQQCTLQHHEGVTPAANPQHTQHASFTKPPILTPPHHISRQQQKTPHLSIRGLFQKNKPAMTYSPTPTKVQYHRREES